MASSDHQHLEPEVARAAGGIVEVHADRSTFVAVRPQEPEQEAAPAAAGGSSWRSPRVPYFVALALLLGLALNALAAVSPVLAVLGGLALVGYVLARGGPRGWRR